MIDQHTQRPFGQNGDEKPAKQSGTSNTRSVGRVQPVSGGEQSLKGELKYPVGTGSLLEELNLREIRILLPDSPSLTREQISDLRGWGDSIVDMLVNLSRARDTRDQNRANQELLHQIRDLVLTEDRAANSEKLGLGINKLWNSVIDFTDTYLDGNPLTSFPSDNNLRGMLISTINACYDPMLSLAAARVLQNVSDTATDPDVNVGVLLGWRYLLSREGIVDADPATRPQALDRVFAEKVNRLVTMPLNSPGTHITNPRALKRVIALATTSLASGSREVPRDAALLHFSRIFIEGVNGQPFMEGNHRTAWILANAWLLQARGEYIPYSREIEKESMKTSAARGQWHWKMCSMLGVIPTALKQFARLLSTQVAQIEQEM